jgi:hypothetical protein
MGKQRKFGFGNRRWMTRVALAARLPCLILEKRFALSKATIRNRTLAKLPPSNATLPTRPASDAL